MTALRQKFPRVSVYGAGLAGCEAALQLARRNVPVELVEMRPARMTAAHKSGAVAELVCSNSFKSTDPNTAAGQLKYELTALSCQLLDCARQSAVGAGCALAVDRVRFSSLVQKLICDEPLIKYRVGELTCIPQTFSIIATGPLSSDAVCAALESELGVSFLHFYDAAAPIVEAASIDYDYVFFQSRYNKGGQKDYLNAPFTREEYEAFVEALCGAKRHIAKAFERSELFCACQPIEELARQGKDVLSHGCLKPVGLKDPRTLSRPAAVVQMRAENLYASAYNLVGFQTNLTFGEQERVFRMIRALKHAQFARYGVMHRNTFVDTPHVLTATLALKKHPQVHLAGQLTGTEGYMEAIASGLFAALALYAQLKGARAPHLPSETAFGALLDYACDPRTKEYQPMHVNYGIIKPIVPHIRNRSQRRAALSARARLAIDAFCRDRKDLFFRSSKTYGA